MIIGIVGPVAEDIEIIQELLTSDKSIQTVDGVEVLRLCEHKVLNSLSTKDYHKQYFLKKLENEFGTVIITGNLILSEDVCKWVMDNGGLIVVVSRNSFEDYDESILKSTEKYWGEQPTQKYNLEVRFKELYNHLKKSNTGVDNLFLIDVSESDCADLYKLTESSEDWPESDKIDVPEENIVEFATVKGDKTMKMEDSIKKAMRELGMEVDGVEDVEEVPDTTVDTKDDSIEGQMTMEDFESQNTSEDVDTNVESIFVKITDGTMALLLPEGLKLTKQTIGDMNFNVATVELPDFTNHKLQELEIKVGVSKSEPTKETHTKNKPVSKTTKPQKPEKVNNPEKPKKVEKVIVESGDLKDLQDEKSRLDGEIKKYRELGDVETVNTLRKQRRAVRNKINTIKKSQ